MVKDLFRSSVYSPFYDIQLIQIGHQDCIPGHYSGPYIRNFYLLHFITKGYGQFSIADREYALQTGDSFFISPGLSTSYRADDAAPWGYIWIGLKGIILPQLLDEAGLSQKSPVLSYSAALLQALRQVELCAEQDGFDSLRTLGQLYLFLHELVKCGSTQADSTPPGRNAYVETAVKYIQQNINEKLSVSGLSDMLGIDRSHFCTIFKRHMGYSPKQYIQTQKMEKAKILLETTDMSIQAIAHLLGYGDQFAFSHAFQQNIGASPKGWRKLHGTSLGSALK